MTDPQIIPKGKKIKAAKKEHYRANLFAYVRFHYLLEGTTGIARKSLEEFGDVTVNGSVVYDTNFQIKPGDVIVVNNGYEHFRTDTVTAERIEQSWR